jgi:hypothetical protein
MKLEKEKFKMKKIFKIKKNLMIKILNKEKLKTKTCLKKEKKKMMRKSNSIFLK